MGLVNHDSLFMVPRRSRLTDVEFWQQHNAHDTFSTDFQIPEIPGSANLYLGPVAVGVLEAEAVALVCESVAGQLNLHLLPLDRVGHLQARVDAEEGVAFAMGTEQHLNKSSFILKVKVKVLTFN